MRIASLLRLALFATLAGCASARVSTDWDRSTRFDAYLTYAWMDTPRMQAMQQTTLFDRRLRTAVEGQLAAKGLRKSEAAGRPDILLVYHAGVQDKVDVQQWGYAGRRWDVRQYNEGTLVVDVVDAGTRSLVWRGTASGEVNGTGDSSERLERAVKKMFTRFPPT